MNQRVLQHSNESGGSKKTNQSFKYEPNWDSLKNYTVPEWFKDAKFGIFIHWGVYAVPAFNNEWYPHFMYRDEVSRRGVNFYQYHREHFGPQSGFGYKDFIPTVVSVKF